MNDMGIEMKVGEVVIVNRINEPPYPAIIDSIGSKLILVNTGGVIEILHRGAEDLNFSLPMNGTSEALKTAIKLQEVETRKALNEATRLIRQELEGYLKTRTFIGWVRSQFKNSG